MSGKNSPLIRKPGQQMMTGKLYNIPVREGTILYKHHVINDGAAALILESGVDGGA